MTSRYREASEVFQIACELSGEERAAYLDEACTDDANLRAEVDELLAFDVDPALLGPDASVHESLAAGTLYAGRYRIATWLGRGSAGVVYLAVDERLGDGVALKILRKSSPARRVQLAREVRLARHVTHPAVCRVHDFGERDGESFLTMEYVDGESVAAMLERRVHFSPASVFEIACDLLGGLAAAHAAGVLHRDLKPANLLVDAEGRVHITDFGIATEGGDATGQGTVGTPGYMAPEQRTSDGALSARTDLYALAVVLYEMLTGARPGDPPERPSLAVGGVDPRLERVILLALDPDPTKRPSSARVMLDQLRNEPAERTPERTASRPPSGLEQRRVTALFLERTDSSVFGAGLPMEEVYEVIAACRVAAKEVLERHGGHVAQRLGNQMLVLFGYPFAQDDAPSRAVQAALELQAESAKLSEQLGAKLAAPIELQAGIQTGTVLVDTARRTQDVFAHGHCVDAAIAMARRAAAGEVMSTADLRRRVEFPGAQWTPRGVLALPGSDEPVEVFDVQPADRPTSEVQPARAMHGREEELRVLLERWQRSVAGEGQLVVLSGDAGMGKSRVLEELQRRLADESPRWITVRCTPYTANTPLFAFIRILGDSLDLPVRELSDEEARTRATAMATEIERPDLVEAFERMLAKRDIAGEENLNRDLVRREAIEAVSEMGRRMGTEAPIVLVFEDLQWIDPSSLEILRGSAGFRHRMRMLMICTTRLGLVGDWSFDENAVELPLGPLAEEEVRRIAVEAAERPLTDEVLAEVVTRAEGNPFFAEELARATSDDGDALSVTLNDSLMASLDALGEDKPLVQAAAVLGRVFPRDLLAPVAQFPEGRALEEALHRLEASGAIVSWGLPTGAQYGFRQTLLRDAAYESIPPQRRARMHERAARAIESSHDLWLTQHPEVLAHHKELAGLDDEAALAWERSAARALESGAPVEVAAHLARALEATARQPASGERDELELHLLLKRGRALLATRDRNDAEVKSTFARALVLCRRSKPAEMTFRSLSDIWLHHTVLCDGSADEMADELSGFAAATGDRHLEAVAESARSQFFHFSGRHRDAATAAQRALALCDRRRRMQDVRRATADVVSISHCALARTAWIVGEPDRARAEAKRAEEAMREVDHPFNSGIVQSLLAYVYWWCGDGVRALETAEENIALSMRHGLGYFAATSRGLRSEIYANAGNGEVALEDAEAQLAMIRAVGGVISKGYAQTQRAGALAVLGRFDEAVETVNEGIRLAENPEDCSLLAEAHRVSGEVLLLRGDPAAARDAFERARAVAWEQGAVAFELRAAIAIARSKDEADRATLREVVSRFGAGDTADLREARRLLGDDRAS